MRIKAKVDNGQGRNDIILETDGQQHSIQIDAKPNGLGSSVNGGELLFLALATCFCNDLYREAAKLELPVSGVEVEVEGEFGQEGEPARHVTYRATVKSVENKERLIDLIQVTDRLAEIQNTLRAGNPVSLVQMLAENG